MQALDELNCHRFVVPGDQERRTDLLRLSLANLLLGLGFGAVRLAHHDQQGFRAVTLFGPEDQVADHLPDGLDAGFDPSLMLLALMPPLPVPVRRRHRPGRNGNLLSQLTHLGAEIEEGAAVGAVDRAKGYRAGRPVKSTFSPGR
ncbi:hypothetical protein [Streptomyces sp. NPDC055107]